MSLYRVPRSSRPLITAVLAAFALLAGGAIGYAIGHDSQPEPSASDVIEQLRGNLRPLTAGLQLLPTEYEQSLTQNSESAAVEGGLARIKAAQTAASSDMRVLDPKGERALAARIAALERAVEAKVAAARVERLAMAAQAALADLPGGS